MSTAYRIPVEQTFAWQQPIKKQQSAPPASPAKGDRYIVAPTGSGDWATHDNAIALCTVGGATPTWEFNTPSAGWECYDVFQSIIVRFSGSAWASDDISGKADKVTGGGTSGNFAGLDGNGNLTNTAIAQSTYNNSNWDTAYSSIGTYDTDYKAIVMNL